MIDVSNLTYAELDRLEHEISKRRTELKKTEYSDMVNAVLNSISAILDAGYEDERAFLDSDTLKLWDWIDLYYALTTELRREKE